MTNNTGSANYPDINKFWPGWQIVDEIDAGSFGTVYKAERQVANTTDYSAVKVIQFPKDTDCINQLKGEGFSDEEIRDIFEKQWNSVLREVKILTELKGYPHIVYVEETHEEEITDSIGWTLYIRMELLDSLSELKREKPADEEEMIKVGKDICRGLSVCKNNNIIHRDIKPSNILWSEKAGEYKLSDFGIAKYDDPSELSYSKAGTEEFIAPEVSTGKYDSRVDIYSLGRVLYYYLNRKLLHDTSQINSDSQLLPPVNASPEMADVILRACAKDPEKRFATAEEMYNALCQVEEHKYVVGCNSDIYKNTQSSSAAEIDNEKSTLQDGKTMRVNPLPTESKDKNSEDVVTAPEKPRKKSGLVIGLAIAAVLALSGIVIFSLSSLANKNKDKSVNENESASGTETVINKPSNEEDDVKSAVQEADDLASKGEYSGALEIIKDAQSRYPNSTVLSDKASEFNSKLRVQVKENALNNANKLSANNNYAGAIQELESISNDYQGDEELTAALNDYREKYKTQVLNDAASLADNGDLSGAIKLLREGQITYNSDEFTSALTTYETKYRSGVLDEAEEAFNSGDYDKTIGLLKNGLVVLPNDSELQAAIAKYQQYEPKKLLSMPVYYFEEKYRDFYTFGSETDEVHTSEEVSSYINFTSIAGGNVYNYGWSLKCSNEYCRYIDAYWKLDGSYNKICGTIVYGSESDVFVDKNALKEVGGQVLIYDADKDVLLYQTDLVNCGNSELSFEANITGVKNLRVRFYICGAYQGWETTFYKIEMALCNVYIKRDK